MSSQRVAAVAVLVLVAATTAPAPAPPVARWFERLADPDPAVRDDARERLMGLSAAELPALLAVVRAAAPIHPAQAAALPEVVRQAFLADDSYETDDADPPRYIMGQGWPADVRVGTGRLGVPVVRRWPGFPAARLLRDGDMVLGLYTDPAAPAAQPPDIPTHEVDDLIQGMRRCPGLPRLAMAVLREGRLIRVVATLAVEPARTARRRAAAVAGFLLDRQQRADAYWQATFAPLVDPPPGPADRADPIDADDGSGR